MPADQDTYIRKMKEGKKFQIRTDKKIDATNDIRWNILGGSFFWLMSFKVGSQFCDKVFSESEKEKISFTKRAGVLTFLKTSTQLQIWFDDVLEVTWVYEDREGQSPCRMRRTMTGIQIKSNDRVSAEYRYAIGIQLRLFGLIA